MTIDISGLELLPDGFVTGLNGVRGPKTCATTCYPKTCTRVSVVGLTRHA
ncbi:hypothetical protein [Acrocarpospora macrocephala]|nr:hypothetical protein [Acrocarpospora macrocephala]